MKFKRFISVFLLCTCLTGLFLTPAAGALEVPDIQAKAALLADVNTDAVAYAKNIHEKNYPASLTKVMTALLILEKVSGNETLLNQEVTASESAFSDTYYHADGSSAGIKAGEVMTVKQLLQCMLIVSANEACNILAEWDAGSIAAFVDAMNAKAKALGCENTHFVNPSGLHDPDHYTSAWDLYLITKAGAKTEEDVKACLHFLDKMCDPEMMALADYGLKDICYDINADGKIVPNGKYDTTNCPHAGLNQAVPYVPYLTEQNPDYQLEKADYQLAYEESIANNVQYAVFNPALGYLAQSDTYAECGSDLVQILDDARTQYICGQIDEAGLQAAFDQWNARGGTQVIEEVNALYAADKA